MNTKLTIAEIPDCLRQSDFYLSLDRSDWNSFIEVPVDRVVKLDAIETLEDLDRYLKMLEFWGVRFAPAELMDYVHNCKDASMYWFAMERYEAHLPFLALFRDFSDGSNPIPIALKLRSGWLLKQFLRLNACIVPGYFSQVLNDGFKEGFLILMEQLCSGKRGDEIQRRSFQTILEYIFQKEDTELLKVVCGFDQMKVYVNNHCAAICALPFYSSILEAGLVEATSETLKQAAWRNRKDVCEYLINQLGIKMTDAMYEEAYKQGKCYQISLCLRQGFPPKGDALERVVRYNLIDEASVEYMELLLERGAEWGNAALGERDYYSEFVDLLKSPGFEFAATHGCGWSDDFIYDVYRETGVDGVRQVRAWGCPWDDFSFQYRWPEHPQRADTLQLAELGVRLDSQVALGAALRKNDLEFMESVAKGGDAPFGNFLMPYESSKSFTQAPLVDFALQHGATFEATAFDSAMDSKPPDWKFLNRFLCLENGKERLRKYLETYCMQPYARPRKYKTEGYILLEILKDCPFALGLDSTVDADPSLCWMDSTKDNVGHPLSWLKAHLPHLLEFAHACQSAKCVTVIERTIALISAAETNHK